MPSAEITQAVLDLLRRAIVDRAFDADTDLVDAAMFDSADFMELLTLLESKFGIVIHTSDLDLGDFRTVERLAAFVERKLQETRR